MTPDPSPPRGPRPDSLADESPRVFRLIATKAGMTEGQLSTAIIAILVAVLLTLTGLPDAARPRPTGTDTMLVPTEGVGAP